MPVLHTFESESGLWPTPCLPGNGGSHGKAKLKAMLWPTPQSHNYKEPGAGHVARGGRHSDLTIAVKRERENRGGQLNPTWVEWLMGWPLGWTDLKPLAMDKFRQWSASHGKR